MDSTPRPRIPLLGSVRRTARLTHVEIGKLFSHRFFPIVLIISIAVTAVLGLLARSFSDTTAEQQTFTNYSLWVCSATYGLRVGIILLVALGAMSMSSEATARTLNTLLTRPVRRVEFALAKILTLVFATVCVVGSVTVTSHIIGGTLHVQPKTAFAPVTTPPPERAWWEMSYGDIRDPHYTDVVIAPKHEVMTAIVLGFTLFVVPVLAAASVSFLIGTLLDSVGLAIGLAIGVFVALEATGLIPVPDELFAVYLYNYPMTLITAVLANAAIGSPPVWPDALAGTLVSVIYIAASFAIAIAYFCRRDVTL
ncbi:ABC transporter permease [bacterium]|nr:ABC transporter permease [bacterium]